MAGGEEGIRKWVTHLRRAGPRNAQAEEAQVATALQSPPMEKSAALCSHLKRQLRELQPRLGASADQVLGEGGGVQTADGGERGGRRKKSGAFKTSVARPHLCSSPRSSKPARIKQREAAAIDEKLMSKPGFSIDQLMELAGLSVASAVFEAYGRGDSQRILVVCGPGNNGGDGLVAARHLVHFGQRLAVYFPKKPRRPETEALFTNLVKQCSDLGIPFLESMPSPEHIDSAHDVVVDAVFGFSFAGTPRTPFDAVMDALKRTSAPIASVDVPSGWDVEKGDPHGTGIRPDLLVSLTAPKLCAKHFHGRHFLGGRFVPPAIAEEYGLDLPPFPGAAQCVELEREST